MDNEDAGGTSNTVALGVTNVFAPGHHSNQPLVAMFRTALVNPV